MLFMEGMSTVRRTAAWVGCALACAATAACSASQPPPISDTDGGVGKVPIDSSVPPPDPCAAPAAGCPCTDAGAQVYCGKVYRVSGTHIDCSDGYLTCQDDGGWSGCVGDAIYDGG